MTNKPAEEVRPFAISSPIPKGRYTRLAIRKNGNQYTFAFTDGEFVFLAFHTSDKIIGANHFEEINGILVTDLAPTVDPEGERNFLFSKHTSGYRVRLEGKVVFDTYLAIRRSKPYPVVCAFEMNGKRFLILAVTPKESYVLKPFTMTRENRLGWELALSNVDNLVFEISASGENECVHSAN
ncbi:MAG: hypothetical protein HGB37_04305 [Candidatus Moranbacteria bacterium]|nr:hypothetical protein [Candidatus Moranbacteria bacterium]